MIHTTHDKVMMNQNKPLCIHKESLLGCAVGTSSLMWVTPTTKVSVISYYQSSTINKPQPLPHAGVQAILTGSPAYRAMQCACAAATRYVKCLLLGSFNLGYN